MRPSILLLLGMALAARPGTAAVVPVAAVGDTSPLGLPFSLLSDPAVARDGSVAFLGAATVVFRRDAAGITHVLGAGDTVDGRTVAGVGAPDQATGGCLALRAVFVGGGAAILRRCGDTVDAVARTGDPVAGGGTLASFGTDVKLGPTGRVAFSAVLSDGATAVLFSDGTGAPTELARTGTPSPAGGTFNALRVLGVSGSGRVGFRGAASGGRTGLFYWNGTRTVKLVVEGDATPTGGGFATIGLASLNDADRWVFRATRSDGVGGLFTADASPARPLPVFGSVVVQGDPTPLGGTFRSFPSSALPSINAAAAVAFRATLSDAPQPAGVFVARPGEPIVASVAVGAPTPAGQLFRLRELLLADDGAVLVRATLGGGQPGLFRERAGRVEGFALLGETTDVGGGFRFTDPSARLRPEDAVFVGQRDGLFVASAAGLAPVALLGDVTPLGGVWAGIDAPVASARGGIVFGGSIQGGRAGEGLFEQRAGRLRTLVQTGERVKKGTRLLDLFGDPLDGLQRPGAGRGGLAFEASLGGAGESGGLLVYAGGRVRTRALIGQPAPRGGRFQAFGTPAVLGRGALAFAAEVGTRRETQLVLRTGRRARTVATAGRDTETRLAGSFRTIGTPAPAADGVVFRATLDGAVDQALFHAGRGGIVVAVLASGDDAPGGGRFQSFAEPAGVGGSAVVRADVAGGPRAGGLFRLDLGRRPADAPAPLAPIALVGDATPLGGTYLAFSAPSGDATGAVAVVADLDAARAATALVLIVP